MDVGVLGVDASGNGAGILVGGAVDSGEGVLAFAELGKETRSSRRTAERERWKASAAS